MESRYPRPQDPSTATGNRSSNNTCAANAEPATPPPRPVPKYCETYPTTFVQADATSFKKVVQMLTGSAETVVAAASVAPPGKTPQPAPPPPVAKVATGPKKPAFKLYERRNSLKNLKMISPLIPAFFNSNLLPPGAGAAAFSPRRLPVPEVPSPSTLDFPALSLSPVTPLIPDPFNRPPHPSSEAAKWAEERAIAEKGFYLHPSPRGGVEPPRLLPLFPLTSPGASTSSSSPSSVAVSPSSP